MVLEKNLRVHPYQIRFYHSMLVFLLSHGGNFCLSWFFPEIRVLHVNRVLLVFILPMSQYISGLCLSKIFQ